MALFALRDISPYEELSYDYNFSLFNPAEGQACKCGSQQCRGVIGGKSQRVNMVLQFYLFNFLLLFTHSYSLFSCQMRLTPRNRAPAKVLNLKSGSVRRSSSRANPTTFLRSALSP